MKNINRWNSIVAPLMSATAVLAVFLSILACKSRSTPPGSRTEESVLQYAVTTTLLDTDAVTRGSIITLTVSDNSDSVSQSELLGVYKDLVQSNTQAANRASETMDLVMKLATCSVALIGAFTAIIGLVGAKNFFDTRKATLSIKRVKQAATRTEKVVEQLEKRAEKLWKDYCALRQDITADSTIIERLQALDYIDRYAMNLFGDDAAKRIAAEKGLREQVKSPDPIVRRECIRVFAEMPKYVEDWSAEEKLVVQLEELAERDVEGGVRKEAKRALDAWRQGERADYQSE